MSREDEQSYDDLIRDEPEGTALDFKRSQYRKEQRTELLLDVLAMANAHLPAQRDRLIILGVDKRPDGKVTIHPIPDGTFTDAAAIQQLVRDNIEPPLTVEYLPHEYEGQRLAILRISECTDRPYVISKQGPGVRRGEIWIRKGTSKDLMLRADLERIYTARAAATGFTEPVHLGFEADGDPTEIVLPSAGPILLASEREGREIRHILEERARIRQHGGIVAVDLLGAKAAGPYIPGVRTSYQQMVDHALREELCSLKEQYADDDEYELYGLHATKVNFVIFNAGDRHLTKVRLEIDVPNVPGVLVAEDEFVKPTRGPFTIGLGNRALSSVHRRGYPNVEVGATGTHVWDELGDVRHQMRTVAFAVPLRIALLDEAIGKTVHLRCTLRAPELREPITRELLIRVEARPDGLPPADDSEDV